MVVVVAVVMTAYACCCDGRRGGCGEAESRDLAGRPGRCSLRGSFGLFFLVPLLSMLDFSTRVLDGPAAPARLGEPGPGPDDAATSIITSLLLALLTVRADAACCWCRR